MSKGDRYRLDRLSETDDRRVWNLSGFTLDHIGLDYRLTLVLGRPASSFTVVIQTDFILCIGPRTYHIDPKQVVSVVPLLPLLHGDVGFLSAERSGRLLLVFEDDVRLEVHRSAQGEAWYSFGDGEIEKAHMKCTPRSSAPWG